MHPRNRPNEKTELSNREEEATGPGQQQTGINWVQGLAGAKGFMVAPGQTAFLMDSEGQTFYMKSADQSGMPTLRVFDFQERTQQSQAVPQNAGAYDDLAKRVAALEAVLMTKEGKSNEPTV